jgi:hypothetical protein|nr:MAG TPA: hypothetical protein [Bacteriophage sp.]
MKIKTIIRWEQLRGKPFNGIDMSDEEDVVALLYCRAICEKGVKCTLAVYRNTTSNHVLCSAQMSALKDEVAMVGQFMPQNEGSCGKTDNIRIADIVSMLVMSGLDAYYAMNEMELCDIPMYLLAYENKRKEIMEERRLWTYLTILPHIDASKMVNGAKDLIAFPWEDNTQKEISDEDVAQFESFMKNGLKFK